MLKRSIALVVMLFPIVTAHAVGTVPAVNSLILDDEKQANLICAEANGLLWCRAPDDGGYYNCTQVCAMEELTPVADDTVWFEAQNSEAECRVIADAVGYNTANILMGDWAYTCAEHDPFNSVLCSYAASCPSSLRVDSDGAGWVPICPCE